MVVGDRHRRQLLYVLLFPEAFEENAATFDRMLLKFPIIGPILVKAAIARFARTLSTMFAAGVPLVEAMGSVAGATGNIVYEEATYRMKDEVATGQRLQRAMENTGLFPNMVVQMIAVGEESGALDTMSSQGRGLLRGGGRQRGRQHVEPARAADHGDPGRAGRRHGHRHVPSDLQARSSRRLDLRRRASTQRMLTDVVDLYAAYPVLFAASVFVIGLVVGSFLNVVIYRLPIMMEREWRAQAADVTASAAATPRRPCPARPRRLRPGPLRCATPRSACPACKAPIKAIHNIPVISWLVLRGRCAACKAQHLSALPGGGARDGHPLRLGRMAFRLRRGRGLRGADHVGTGRAHGHRHRPSTLAGQHHLAAPVGGTPGIGPARARSGAALPVTPKDAIMGAAAGYLSLWAVFHAFRLITGKEGMGFGDFKLFAALGAWMGWKVLPLVILLSAATGAALGIFMILLRGRDRAAPMPFGPYLAAAGWLAMLYGHELVDGYLRVSGLRH